MGTILGKGGLTFGTAFDDMIIGTADFDFINAGAGDDQIGAEGGDDFIFAGAGNDTLAGGQGVDLLDGGTGNDTFIGGPGADTFIFRPFEPGSDGSSDLIADFNLHEDVLIFDMPGNAKGYDFSALDFAIVGNDMVITVADTDQHVTLQGFGLAMDVPLKIGFI